MADTKKPSLDEVIREARTLSEEQQSALLAVVRAVKSTRSAAVRTA